jgi:hypothetical protein
MAMNAHNQLLKPISKHSGTAEHDQNDCPESDESSDTIAATAVLCKSPHQGRDLPFGRLPFQAAETTCQSMPYRFDSRFSPI